MDITLLIQSAMGLIVLLAILIFLLFFSSSAKTKTKQSAKNGTQAKQKEKTKTDLASLKAIIKNKTSSTSQLKEALDLVLKHHGQIHGKLGLRPHPDFDDYMDILFTICRHKNTDKSIILKFDKELAKLNPEYKSNINDAITKGLNSRGA